MMAAWKYWVTADYVMWKKVRVGAVQKGFIFEAGVIQSEAHLLTVVPASVEEV